MRSIPGQGNALETEPSFDDAAGCPFENFYRANRNEKQPDYQYHCAYLPILRICCTFGGKRHPKPSACRSGGSALGFALSGRSKIGPLRRKNTRRLGCGGSANSKLSALACGRLCQPPAPGARTIGRSLSLQAIMRRFKTAFRGEGRLLRFRFRPAQVLIKQASYACSAVCGE